MLKLVWGTDAQLEGREGGSSEFPERIKRARKVSIFIISHLYNSLQYWEVPILNACEILSHVFKSYT